MLEESTSSRDRFDQIVITEKCQKSWQQNNSKICPELIYLRLQQGIIKQSTDHSNFGWHPNAYHSGSREILASSPAPFALSRDKRPHRYSFRCRSYSFNNAGLLIRLPLTPWLGNIYLALLNCNPAKGSDSGRVGMFVKKVRNYSFDPNFRDYVFELHAFEACYFKYWRLEEVKMFEMDGSIFCIIYVSTFRGHCS